MYLGFIFILSYLQVSQYITDGLERARDSLTEAAALRERFVLGTSVSRRVAAAAASAVIFRPQLFLLSQNYHSFFFFGKIYCLSLLKSDNGNCLKSCMQAEAAAAAGESSFRSFMVAVQRCGSSVAIVQQVR